MAIDIPPHVKDFIFQYIDSVEQLEILLLLFGDLSKSWSVSEISNELRSNRNSVEKRLKLMINQKFIVEDAEVGKFRFQKSDDRINGLIGVISDFYRVKKYGIMEMIFSPMKKSRDFANAFRLTSSKDDGGEGNG